MHDVRLVGVLLLAACATPRASEVIPLVPVPVPVTVKNTVRRTVVDERVPGAPRAAEDVLSNDVVALVQNRLALELARNGVRVDAAGDAELHAAIYDYRYEWHRRGVFVDYTAEAFARVRLTFTQHATVQWGQLVSGHAKQQERGWEPVVVVADQLERALDDAMRDAQCPRARPLHGRRQRAVSTPRLRSPASPRR